MIDARTEIAARIAAAYVANPNPDMTLGMIADNSVSIADILLAQLERPKTNFAISIAKKGDDCCWYCGTKDKDYE